MKKDYYCNCEVNCIHKQKKLRKRLIYENGKIRKTKVQICLNPHKDCTCKWQVPYEKAFNY